MKKQLLFIILIFCCAFNARSQAPELWGTTMGGGAGSGGTIFKMNGDSTGYQTMYSFSTSSGYSPRGSLCLAPNGKLYGATNLGGGTSGVGSVYCFDPSVNVFTKIVDFNYTNGAYSWGSLTLASNGMLYGNSYGGTNGYGNIFRVNPANNSFASLYNFTQAGGSSPGGKMVQAYNGLLYGLNAYDGGAGYGGIFSYNPSDNIYTNVHNFVPATGTTGYGSLCLASDSNLYGMARAGGQYGVGVLFRFNPYTNAYTKLVDFDTLNGKFPWNGLLQVTGTKLYGMTANGGTYKWGVIFSYDYVSGIYTLEHSFDKVTDGSVPFGGLMRASDGSLYGMTYSGGAYQLGTAFRFDPASGAVIVLENFNSPGGASPYGDFIEIPKPEAVQQMSASTSFSIYPNPSPGILHVLGHSLNSENLHLVITDMLGQAVMENIILVSNNSFASEFDLHNFANGIYFITLSNGEALTISKLLIQH